jgi:hypothetical protein
VAVALNITALIYLIPASGERKQTMTGKSVQIARKARKGPMILAQSLFFGYPVDSFIRYRRSVSFFIWSHSSCTPFDPYGDECIQLILLRINSWRSDRGFSTVPWEWGRKEALSKEPRSIFISMEYVAMGRKPT